MKTMQNTNITKQLNAFLKGDNVQAYDFLGANILPNGDVTFRVWAPKAQAVSLVGDFNSWDTTVDVMTEIADSGVYEVTVKGLNQYDNYKYCVKQADGKDVYKA
ncbi:MAG: 1,4-alpha-glucan branching protein GlgB, partial [Oscillospiraceae bacterium]